MFLPIVYKNLDINQFYYDHSLPLNEISPENPQYTTVKHPRDGYYALVNCDRNSQSEES
jgi:hypothetical protein